MSEKITQFRDIPQFTRFGSWECDYDLKGFIETIERWKSKEEGSLDLEPDFQRAHVWTEAQQVAWLEFFLRGGKTGRVVYFNQPGWMSSFKGDFVVVDGKQRIEAIRRFVSNEIKVFGSFYNEYTDSLRMTQTLSINVNNLKTKVEVLQWYLDFNTSGTPHTSDEIERARALLEAEKA